MTDLDINLSAQSVGKIVNKNLYVHKDAVGLLSNHLFDLIKTAEVIANYTPGEHYNVIKINIEKKKVSFLNYKNFYDATFPELQESCSIDLQASKIDRRIYRYRRNPPILHRKELLIDQSHPRYDEYAYLTRQLESRDLFRNPKEIGKKLYWEKRLASSGHTIVNYKLIDDKGEIVEPIEVERHKTAINRYDLSTPVKALEKHGYLDGSRTLFDFGCGKGDDLKILEENGVPASGWDPYYCPNNEKIAADIVNLGFVLNVIENQEERAQTLIEAFSLANQAIIISAMLEGRQKGAWINRGDGVVTSRNTFQKYYTQSELSEYIETVLDESPISFGPGIFLVFKDKLEEQRYFERKQRSRASVSRLVNRVPRLSRKEKEEKFYFDNKELLDEVWVKWLSLGRKPKLHEIQNVEAIENLFGTTNKALNFIERVHGHELLDEAETLRRNDLLVFLAVRIFDRRRGYRALPEELKKDIGIFFGTQQNAKELATDLLFSVSEVEKISAACFESADQGVGWLDRDRSLQLHTSMLEELPPILRVYVSCGLKLYGDISNADIVKIHIQSGKLTLMIYDDFDGKPLPRLIERVKILLRDQSIQFYDYVDNFEPPYLLYKSRFITSDFPNYELQCKFDKNIGDLALYDEFGFDADRAIFDKRLRELGFEVEGFDLRMTGELPGLDDKCGKYFTFRDFIQCGETQKRIELPNIPKEPETYYALRQLAIHVIDPIIDYFGGIELTYGFCSADLAREIQGGIAPKIDQHASYEKNRAGKHICTRLGAAVDFIIRDESMLEVARWITINILFDRLYYYGDDKPLHVSYGPDFKQEIVVITEKNTKAGIRRIPKTISKTDFLKINEYLGSV